MTLTLHDATPIGLCVVTQDLLDVKRFRANFCDMTILRLDDYELKEKVKDLKVDINSALSESKFLDGYKVVITSNIDKIIAMITSRYLQTDIKTTESVIANAKIIMRKVMAAKNFDQLAVLEPEFKTKVTFPLNSLFNKSLSESKS